MNQTDHIKFTWQLVAEFVSWEFCRYMCEQTEKRNDGMKSDVLTFFESMVLERTNYPKCDYTKQEIVAKFVMDVRASKEMEKLPYIQDLAKTVVKICPELKKAVDKFLPVFKDFLSLLELNEGTEYRKRILYSIVDAEYDFIKEACKVLPLPHLLQMLDPWLHSDSQDLIGKNSKENELCTKTIECLRKEKITFCETKIIADSVYNDQELERLFLNVSDSEIGSEQPSPLKPSPLREKFHSLLRNSPKAGPSRTIFHQAPLESSFGFKVDKKRNSVVDSDSPPIMTATQRRNFKKHKNLLSSPLVVEPSSELRNPSNSPPKVPLDADSSLFLTIKESQASNKQTNLAATSSVNISSKSPPMVILDADSSPFLSDVENWESDKQTANLAATTSVNISSKSPPRVTLDAESSPFLTDLEVRGVKQISNLTAKSSAKLNDLGVLNSSNEDIFDSESEDSPTLPPVKSTPFKKSTNLPNTSDDIRKKNREKYLEFIQNVEDLSQEGTSTQSSHVFSCLTQDMGLSLLLAASPQRYNYEEDGDSSDCDKHGEVRFLTPTVYKKDSNPHPSPQKTLSEYEKESPFCLTDQSSDQTNDPSFRPSAASPQKNSPPKPKKSQKKKIQPKRKQEKQLQSDKEPKIPRQMTLRKFGFASDDNNKELPKRNTARKKPFKLFDNDLMSKNLDESSLFEKKETKTKIKIESLRTKKQCPECQQKFKTNILLKKHVFIMHASDVI